MSLLRAFSAVAVASVVALSVLTAAASQVRPSVLARYEIQRAKVAAERFELLRTENRIEHRFLDRGVTEIWQRDARGEVEHWKVFLRDEKAVHYNAGDLRTLHTWPAWEQLGSLVDAAARAKLSAAPRRRRVHGESAVDLRGSSHGHGERMLWLDSLSVPAEMSLGHGSEEATFRLSSFERCDDACVLTPLDGVEEIEFADVGDRERDPFVRRFLAYTGHPHAH